MFVKKKSSSLLSSSPLSPPYPPGTNPKTVSARPAGYLNAIYENVQVHNEVSKNASNRPKWNSSFSVPSTSSSSSSSSPSSSSLVGMGKYTKSKKEKKNVPNGVTPISSKLPPSVLTKSSATTGATKRSSSTGSSIKTELAANASSSSSSSSFSSSSSSTTTLSSTVSTPTTTNLPSTTLTTASVTTSTSKTLTSTSNIKPKQRNKPSVPTQNNLAFDNQAFSGDTSPLNIIETSFKQLQQPPKTTHLNTHKTRGVTPAKADATTTTTKTTINDKSIYSLAGKVPMSYNLSNGMKSQQRISSSFSSSSLSSASTVKSTSGYSTSSSLCHSASLPSISLSSASSSADASSISSKLSTIKTPDDVWLSKVETSLRSLTIDNTHVTTQEVKKALQVKESFVTDRFVQLLNKHDDGRIAVSELMAELRTLVRGTQMDKLRFLFNVYNVKGNGHIARTDLQTFFTKLIEECKLQISNDNIQALTNAFFQAADRNRDGKITFDEMQTMLQKRPSIVDNIAISPTGVQPSGEIKGRPRFRYFSKTYIQNNLRKIITLIIFVIVNLSLISLALCWYWDQNTWIKVARSTGQALNFNCTLVLVLMLRRTLTWLRNTPLSVILPFDQHVMFHRMSGYLIALMGVVHIVGHVGNSVVTADSSKGTAIQQLFTTRAGVGWVADSAYITGDVLFVVLFIMVALSLPVIRRSGFFEVFYWSHKLYLVFWAVLILHAPNFWKWFLVPGSIFVLELIARQPCVRAFYMGKTYIEQVSLLPSDVTHIIVSRPPGFHFKPGDYVFIQVPVVAKYEWHPFTLSSAPENMEELWLHIRTAGHWTRSLHKYFSDYTTTDVETGPESNPGNNDFFKAFIKRRASSIAWLKTKPLKARKINSTIRKRVVTKNAKVLVHIDGPYGTPSRDIFQQEHAVLIGSGIGITPFASILQSIVSRYKASYVQCQRCSHQWCHETPASVMTLKKVDFVWIIRDQRQIEWFTSLLCQLEREQEVEGGLGGIIDIHIYMTSVPPKTDMRGMGLQLALDLVHEDEKTDLLTGLRTRTEAGRPDFDKLFSKIKDNSQGRRVKVFFCGSPLLGTTLKLYSHKFDFAFAHEYF